MAKPMMYNHIKSLEIKKKSPKSLRYLSLQKFYCGFKYYLSLSLCIYTQREIYIDNIDKFLIYSLIQKSMYS